MTDAAAGDEVAMRMAPLPDDGCADGRRHACRLPPSASPRHVITPRMRTSGACQVLLSRATTL